jgi:hypothetical protein
LKNRLARISSIMLLLQKVNFECRAFVTDHGGGRNKHGGCNP